MDFQDLEVHGQYIYLKEQKSRNSFQKTVNKTFSG